MKVYAIQKYSSGLFGGNRHVYSVFYDRLQAEYEAYNLNKKADSTSLSYYSHNYVSYDMIEIELQPVKELKEDKQYIKFIKEKKEEINSKIAKLKENSKENEQSIVNLERELTIYP